MQNYSSDNKICYTLIGNILSFFQDEKSFTRPSYSCLDKLLKRLWISFRHGSKVSNLDEKFLTWGSRVKLKLTEVWLDTRNSYSTQNKSSIFPIHSSWCGHSIDITIIIIKLLTSKNCFILTMLEKFGVLLNNNFKWLSQKEMNWMHFPSDNVSIDLRVAIVHMEYLINQT